MASHICGADAADMLKACTSSKYAYQNACAAGPLGAAVPIGAAPSFFFVAFCSIYNDNNCFCQRVTARERPLARARSAGARSLGPPAGAGVAPKRRDLPAPLAVPAMAVAVAAAAVAVAAVAVASARRCGRAGGACALLLLLSIDAALPPVRRCDAQKILARKVSGAGLPRNGRRKTCRDACARAPRHKNAERGFGWFSARARAAAARVPQHARDARAPRPLPFASRPSEPADRRGKRGPHPRRTP